MVRMRTQSIRGWQRTWSTLASRPPTKPLAVCAVIERDEARLEARVDELEDGKPHLCIPGNGGGEVPLSFRPVSAL
jgi:hypothetical protein